VVDGLLVRICRDCQTPSGVRMQGKLSKGFNTSRSQAMLDTAFLWRHMPCWTLSSWYGRRVLCMQVPK